MTMPWDHPDHDVSTATAWGQSDGPYEQVIAAQVEHPAPMPEIPQDIVMLSHGRNPDGTLWCKACEEDCTADQPCTHCDPDPDRQPTVTPRRTDPVAAGLQDAVRRVLELVRERTDLARAQQLADPGSPRRTLYEHCLMDGPGAGRTIPSERYIATLVYPLPPTGYLGGLPDNTLSIQTVAYHAEGDTLHRRPDGTYVQTIYMSCVHSQSGALR